MVVKTEREILIMIRILEYFYRIFTIVERDSSTNFTGRDVCGLCVRVPPGHGKSWNLRRPFSRPGKSWKIAMVMEKSWKMMIISWNFYYCTEQFCKSDTTSFIKLNYEPFYLFNNGTTSRWNCHY